MKKLTMTIAEVAEQLSISKPKAYELARQEAFPMLKLGKRMIVPVEAFEEWLQASAKNRLEIPSGGR